MLLIVLGNLAKVSITVVASWHSNYFSKKIQIDTLCVNCLPADNLNEVSNLKNIKKKNVLIISKRNVKHLTH